MRECINPVLECLGIQSPDHVSNFRVYDKETKKFYPLDDKKSRVEGLLLHPTFYISDHSYLSVSLRPGYHRYILLYKGEQVTDLYGNNGKTIIITQESEKRRLDRIREEYPNAANVATSQPQRQAAPLTTIPHDGTDSSLPKHHLKQL